MVKQGYLLEESLKIRNELVAGNDELILAIKEHIHNRNLDHITRIYPEPSITEGKGWALFKLGHYGKSNDPLSFGNPSAASQTSFDHYGKEYDFFALHPYEVFRHDIHQDITDEDYLNMIYILEKKAQFFEDMSASGNTIAEFCIGLVSGQFAALLIGGKSPANSITDDLEYLKKTPSISVAKPKLRFMALENIISQNIPQNIRNKLKTKK